MILTCPACDAQFRVDRSKIPHSGREVRCANCHHQWHAYPDGAAAELTPPPPLEESASAQEEVSRLIAFPDPEREEPEDEDAPQADALPEEQFADDYDSYRDPEPDEEAAADMREEGESTPAFEPVFQSTDLTREESDPYAFAPEELSSFGATPSGEETNASIKPLIATAAILLVGVIITSFFALRPAMQGPFGFVYTLFGSPPSSGLALSEIALRERPSRSKARYIIEGVIENRSEQAKQVPLLRIGMVDQEGQLMQSREYEDETHPVIAPGERYEFKAANLETDSKDRLAWFVLDIGRGGELLLRKFTDGLPSATQNEMPHG